MAPSHPLPFDDINYRPPPLMLPRLFQLKCCTNQDVECRMIRNGVCTNGFFSALGPTNLEICHAHARDKDCTELYSQTPESDSRSAPPIAVRRGVRRDGRTLAESVAAGTSADGSKQPEGGTQASESADGQPTHRSGSASRGSSVAAHVVPQRATTGESRWTGRRSPPTERSWSCVQWPRAQVWDEG